MKLLMTLLIHFDTDFPIRYTQTAVASFGSQKNKLCGKVPAGFTRLTHEVLDWVKKTAGVYHPGINDPGEMLIVHNHSLQ